MDFKLSYLKEGKDLTSPVDQAKYISEIITELNKIALVGAGHIGTLVAERLVKKPRKSKIPRLLQTLHHLPRLIQTGR